MEWFCLWVYHKNLGNTGEYHIVGIQKYTSYPVFPSITQLTHQLVVISTVIYR